MTSTVNINGRFGNHFIRNVLISILAKKHNLKVEYSYKEEIESLGIELFSGDLIHSKSIELNDSNLMTYLMSNTELSLNFTFKFHCYFQTKQISNYLHFYLQKPDIKDAIIASNQYKERYNTNTDAFVHVRLGDVISYNPGFAYYDNAISALEFSTLYISSDSIDHEICQSIIKKFPNSVVIDYSIIDIIKFASTCKYVILSHGSFSATIGNLSYYSSVYYPKYDKKRIWYGDMFSVESWNEIS